MIKAITDYKQTKHGPGVVAYHLDNGLQVIFANVISMTGEPIKVIQFARNDKKVITLTLDEINMIQEHAKQTFKRRPK